MAKSSTSKNAGRSTTGEPKVPYYIQSQHIEAAKHLRLTVTRYISERASLREIEEAMSMLRSEAPVQGEAGYRHDGGDAAPECKPKCAFCGRSADRVRLLLTGRIKGSFICDVCILKAMHGLVDKFTVGAEVA